WPFRRENTIHRLLPARYGCWPIGRATFEPHVAFFTPRIRRDDIAFSRGALPPGFALRPAGCEPTSSLQRPPAGILFGGGAAKGRSVAISRSSLFGPRQQASASGRQS